MNSFAEIAPPRLETLPNPFRILLEGRTYGSLLYLLLGFPLGLLYFVLFAVGIASGLGLMIVAIGAIILLMLVLLSWMFTLFERQLAIWLLGAEIAPAKPASWPDSGWPWIRAVFANPVTWKGMLFLGLRFPLGLASWVATVVIVSVVGALFVAPVSIAMGESINIFPWRVETYPEAALLSLIGLALLIPTAYFVSGLGGLWARLAEWMLGQAPAETTVDA